MNARPVVLLPLLGSLFALPLLAGCKVEPDMERCIDARGTVVANRLCQRSVQTLRLPGSIYPVREYRVYYGGYGTFDLGTKAWGGSEQPLRWHTYQTNPPSTGPATGGTVGSDPASGYYPAAPHGGM